jgi:hypothetical protein
VALHPLPDLPAPSVGVVVIPLADVNLEEYLLECVEGGVTSGHRAAAVLAVVRLRSGDEGPICRKKLDFEDGQDESGASA